jgi:hypothetical protein
VSEGQQSRQRRAQTRGMCGGGIEHRSGLRQVGWGT